MAVDEKEDFKGRRKRNVKDVPEGEGKTSEVWRTAFPVNITVDELYLYRKKKNNFAWLNDNLKIEEGSFKHLKTEYTRRFKNFYDILQSSINENEKDLFTVDVLKAGPSLKLEGIKECLSEYNESFKGHVLQRSKDTAYGMMNEVFDNESSNRLHPLEAPVEDKHSASERPRLLKKPTHLKIEGDLSHITEYADKFIEYLLAKRAELCRTPTTLKLGTGEMESKTETTDQFRKFDNVERPNLIRQITNLHLQSDLDVKREQQEKYPPYDVKIRPRLVKKLTNLHLEGDHSLIPEYRHQYVQYENVERSGPILPVHNLKSASLFEANTETNTFGRSSPLIPFLRESYSYHDLEDDKKMRRNVSSSRYQSNVSLNRTSSHPNLVKSAGVDDNSRKRTFKPQSPHKNAYLDFDKNKNLSLERRKSRIDLGLSHVPTSSTDVDYQGGKLFLQPEYKSAFTEFPRERPRTRRPESNFTTEGEVNYLSEKRDKFVKHKEPEKRQSLRRKSEFFFEEQHGHQSDSEQPFDGRFECQPEYRKALIDYLIKEKPPAGQRRRILEIPDIIINSDTNAEEISSPNDNTQKNKTTSQNEERPNTSTQKPPSSSSSVPSSPKAVSNSAQGTRRPSSKDGLRCHSKIETVRLSPTKKKRVFRRSSTPSPVPPEKSGITNRESSPNLSGPAARSAGSWKSQLKPSSSSDTNIWSSTETDPAFFIVNDRVPSRKSIRHNLYKEQKWMPAWYSGGL